VKEMLTQEDANALLEMIKEVIQKGIVQFPSLGERINLDLQSLDKKTNFIIDVNRRGRIKINKYSYQKRYRKDERLLRVDVNGPPHTNPDGAIIQCPHIHIYQENYDLSWAFELPPIFHDTDDLISTLYDFLEYCKVNNTEEILFQGGLR